MLQNFHNTIATHKSEILPQYDKDILSTEAVTKLLYSMSIPEFENILRTNVKYAEVIEASLGGGEPVSKSTQAEKPKDLTKLLQDQAASKTPEGKSAPLKKLSEPENEKHEN